MTEQKQEYQTDWKEPPNLHKVKCCASCYYYVENDYYGDTCAWHGVDANPWNICDDYCPDD